MRSIATVLFVLIAGMARTQSLPAEFHYSADGKILHTGGVIPTSGLYNKDVVKDVFLNFEQANYWTLLTNNYASETNIVATMVYDGVTYPNVGVRFRGNTSYTMIGGSQKKSFAVETDFVDTTQAVLGYKNMKFNNAHQDQSFMREVLFSRMAARHTPIAKGNYIHLYLNNQDWGLYPNVQSVDKTFLKEWFASNDGARFRATTENTGTPGGGGGPGWGDGTAGMNYLGDNPATYQQYYSLKSNDVPTDPWQSLIDACQTLSTATADNIDALKAKIDVDKVLWHLACENIFTDDDSYVMKGKMDYMVYVEPETGRTTSLEYDGNSSFQANAATSSTWGPFKNATNANYPLLNKLLNIPEFRQRYLAHYRTILNETFTTANATELVNALHAQIGALVAADPKKLYTTAQYNTSYPALIAFVTNRRAFLLSNAEVAQVAPTIASAKFYNAADEEYAVPTAHAAAHVKAEVAAAAGVQRVNLYFATGLVGNFDKVQMFDDGNHNDGAAADGTYGAAIPGYSAGTMVRYYVEAIASNAAQSAAYLPTGAEHDVFVYTVAAGVATNGVVINEIVAQNTSGTTDEAGQYEDWVELYNNNDFEVDLSGFYLTDNTDNLTKWAFPAGSVIPANGYLLVWADEDEEDGPLHANFKLSAGGESVTLSDPDQNEVDQVVFGAQTANMGYARVPNGTGDFVIQAPTFMANNETMTSTDDAALEQAACIMYPNPASTQVYIRVAEAWVGQPLAIYNALGQRVHYAQAQAEQQVSTVGFVPGMYVVQCGRWSQQLVVE